MKRLLPLLMLPAAALALPAMADDAGVFPGSTRIVQAQNRGERNGEVLNGAATSALPKDGRNGRALPVPSSTAGKPAVSTRPADPETNSFGKVASPKQGGPAPAVVPFETLKALIENDDDVQESTASPVGERAAGESGVEAGSREAVIEEQNDVERSDALAAGDSAADGEAAIAAAQASGEWTDPVIEEEARDSFDTGFISRQSRMSETLILLDRQARIGNAIGKLIEIYGPDATIEVAPGDYRSFPDFPAAVKLRSQMESDRIAMEATRLKMENERRKAEMEYQHEQARLIEEEQKKKGLGAAARDEGEPAAEAAVRWSLRETFGSRGEMEAVLMPSGGGDRQRVKAGDVLSGGAKVTEIGNGYLLLDRGGSAPERLTLRN